MVAVDFRAVIMICDQSLRPCINNRDQRRSVYVCRTWKNRMVITENDSLMRELPKCGRIFVADKIGAHPVPNHNHDMSVGLGRLGCIAEHLRQQKSQ